MKRLRRAYLFWTCISTVWTIGVRNLAADDNYNIHMCVHKVHSDFDEPARRISRVMRQEQGKLAVLSGKEWPTGAELAIGFLGGSEELRAKIKEAALEWTRYANIQFRFLEDQHLNKAVIRIGFTRGIGSWSYHGTEALLVRGTEPTMNFGWLDERTSNLELRRVVLHEFGHALGAAHEHQLPQGKSIPWNRPAVYAWYKLKQNWEKPQVDAQVFELFSREMVYKDDEDIDPNSIMMYPIPAELTIGGYQVGWNNELSATDKQVIRRVYPKDD
jgi:serralysin